ncbi:hypothetical protein Pelo_12351 [Pelomyxa schiedti]|nr:hypothetical protein Pelo_12351 [Pelomyxa schiedti]
MSPPSLSSDGDSPLLDLPDELILRIVSSLGLRGILRTSVTCNQLKLLETYGKHFTIAYKINCPGQNLFRFMQILGLSLHCCSIIGLGSQLTVTSSTADSPIGGTQQGTFPGQLPQFSAPEYSNTLQFQEDMLAAAKCEPRHAHDCVALACHFAMLQHGFSFAGLRRLPRPRCLFARRRCCLLLPRLPCPRGPAAWVELRRGRVLVQVHAREGGARPHVPGQVAGPRKMSRKPKGAKAYICPTPYQVSAALTMTEPIHALDTPEERTAAFGVIWAAASALAAVAAPIPPSDLDKCLWIGTEEWVISSASGARVAKDAGGLRRLSVRAMEVVAIVAAVDCLEITGHIDDSHLLDLLLALLRIMGPETTDWDSIIPYLKRIPFAFLEARMDQFQEILTGPYPQKWKWFLCRSLVESAAGRMTVEPDTLTAGFGWYQTVDSIKILRLMLWYESFRLLVTPLESSLVECVIMGLNACAQGTLVPNVAELYTSVMHASVELPKLATEATLSVLGHLCSISASNYSILHALLHWETLKNNKYAVDITPRLLETILLKMPCFEWWNQSNRFNFDIVELVLGIIHGLAQVTSSTHLPLLRFVQENLSSNVPQAKASAALSLIALSYTDCVISTDLAEKTLLLFFSEDAGLRTFADLFPKVLGMTNKPASLVPAVNVWLNLLKYPPAQQRMTSISLVRLLLDHSLGYMNFTEEERFTQLSRNTIKQ